MLFNYLQSQYVRFYGFDDSKIHPYILWKIMFKIIWKIYNSEQKKAKKFTFEVI